MVGRLYARLRMAGIAPAVMDDLRNRKGYARNNLAGAMWEQSLSTEMQAVASKYAAEIDAKQERIKRLRAELDR